MLDTPLMSLLEKSLDYASTQQSAISANISNVNTPGYERKDASFASVLDAASSDGSGANGAFQSNTPQPGQISVGNDDGGSDTTSNDIPVVTDHSGAMRIDGNNVDVDTEMSKLAQNQIYYQAVSQFESGQLSGLKYVISGG